MLNEGKETFICYKDWKIIFDSLEMLQRGYLITAIFDYVSPDASEPTFEDSKTKMAFDIIANKINHAEKKYAMICEKRKQAGKRGGLAKARNEKQDVKEEPEEKKPAEETPASSAKGKQKKEATEVFERLWQMYPNKKGKSQVSDTKKLQLLKVGEEQVALAIERYKEDREKKQKNGKFTPEVMNGSTFFNGRFMDYLGDNWEGGEKAVEHTETRDWGLFDNYI